MKIALYQPEIAGNVGTIIRNCACFGADLHIIEPCGFPFDVQKIKRSAMDYYDLVKIVRHNSFNEFYEEQVIGANSRLILATTKADKDIKNFRFTDDDVVLFGQESTGLPQEIHQKASEKIKISMKENTRSLNLAISCGIILHQGSFRSYTKNEN